MAQNSAGPAFGTAFTPHMLVQRYENSKWGKSEIIPYASFSLPPAAVVFHYGQEIFEGFKAYKQPDGTVSLFRPDRNFARLNASAARLCMPSVDIKSAIADVGRLIKTDKAQLPER